MIAIDCLTWGLRLFFWVATTMALRQGSLFALGLCVTIFLVIEYFLEELEQVTHT